MSSEAPPSQFVEHDTPRRVAGRRLVLAEDDQDLRETLALALRRDGYEVIELADGWQLRNYLASHAAVDLVISDVRMPGKSGLEVLVDMQSAQRHPPPFILVTAFGDDQTRAEALRLGAVALLGKPFGLPALRTLIREVLSRKMRWLEVLQPGRRDTAP